MKNKIKLQQEYIKLQREYIEHLGECYDGAFIMAYVHSYRETPERIDKGKELRDKMTEVEFKLNQIQLDQNLNSKDEVSGDSLKAIYHKLDNEDEINPMCKALGYDEQYQGQIALGMRSHYLTFNNVMDSIKWLFSEGYDVISPKK